MKYVVAMILFMVSITALHAQDTSRTLTVSILTPLDSSQVVPRQIITGSVSDPSVQVWVVIMPEETNEYWVQPRTAVRKDGTWSVRAYLGEEGTPSGTPFQVRAFANPRSALKPGRTNDWPEAEAESELVFVTR